MTTTANHRAAAGGNMAPEPEEDIAAIAKQISDHAEAIYQTWKARGLAPNEILTCHRDSSAAADKFGSALTPQPKLPVDVTAPAHHNRGTQLMADPNSTNNLERLVNKFVVEDKARLQAARQSRSLSPKPFASSIQYALQKFEQKASSSTGPVPEHLQPQQQQLQQQQAAASKQNVGGGGAAKRYCSKPSPMRNYVASPDADDNKGVDGPAWPFRNGGKSAAVQSQQNTCDFMDEVAKEEQRLIDALKNGSVVENRKPEKPAVPSKEGVLLRSAAGGYDAAATGHRSKPEFLIGLSALSSARRNQHAHRQQEQVPHPELTDHQRANIRSNHHQSNPVRPFLTRGSVAERVLIFEKCPTELMKNSAVCNSSSAQSSWKNIGSDVHSKIQNYSKETNQKPGAPPPHTTLQRHTKANRNVFIPRFYYPFGKPESQQQWDTIVKTITDFFMSLPNSQASKHHFGQIAKLCNCPLYWKHPLFFACGGDLSSTIDVNTFLNYWKDVWSSCHDLPSIFIRILARNSKKQTLSPENFILLVQDVVDSHPGLTFLKTAPEFHSRYVHTVISRIFYSVNTSWSGDLSLAEIRRSDLMRVIDLLEKEEDINQVTAYFSYEHFYVIYCKFWELDRDHDLFISKTDLARHSDHALSTRIIDRIFSGTVTKRKQKNSNNNYMEEKMSYTEFVWFLMAEEDKRHPRAVEYWFRCMDIDGDGYLSMYELEYFYDEQLQRMESIGIECLPFEDCLCQMLDMVKPKCTGKISLADLKTCKMTPIFFDTFFNLEKYLDHEQRDPFASQRDNENEASDWDKYAAEEYEMLVAEEGGNDAPEEINGTDIEDILSPNLDDVLKSCTFNKISNQPRVLVTDFSSPSTMYDDNDSSDYAGDSDDDI
ncbi:serine/threonine-protein phosphatase 2A regulatory subunit B'' subunit alpha isoform X2 [Metopolophium dirhodum]|uniref:serine/threonine-protein phosphatase 2A regulatory subunit B'' subunit alpha isoform X2 n=1 Tax=Metopolophium dirhodum TaxID=44670 RepID=UPI00298FABF6|nr:serine/threonine-protein phosphatase 2A regulatory subunit B'' subunit alpha isoform X2 [Metopolophium dirhodum]